MPVAMSMLARKNLLSEFWLRQVRGAVKSCSTLLTCQSNFHRIQVCLARVHHCRCSACSAVMSMAVCALERLTTATWGPVNGPPRASCSLTCDAAG